MEYTSIASFGTCFAFPVTVALAQFQASIKLVDTTSAPMVLKSFTLVVGLAHFAPRPGRRFVRAIHTAVIIR